MNQSEAKKLVLEYLAEYLNDTRGEAIIDACALDLVRINSAIEGVLDELRRRAEPRPKYECKTCRDNGEVIREQSYDGYCTEIYRVLDPCPDCDGEH